MFDVYLFVAYRRISLNEEKKSFKSNKKNDFAQDRTGDVLRVKQMP